MGYILLNEIGSGAAGSGRRPAQLRKLTCELGRPGLQYRYKSNNGRGGKGRAFIKGYRGDRNPSPRLFFCSPQRIGARAGTRRKAAAEGKPHDRVSRRIDQIRLKRVFGRERIRRQTFFVERGTTHPAARLR